MLFTFQSITRRSPRRSCSRSRYCRHSSTSSASGVELAVVAHQHAEEVGEVLERGLRAPRLAAHQRQHRGDAVEQEMRADARLQRLQPRLGDRRRQRARAQPEVARSARTARSTRTRDGAISEPAASPAICGSSASTPNAIAQVMIVTIADRAAPARSAREPAAAASHSTASSANRCGSTKPVSVAHSVGERRQARLARERDQQRRAVHGEQDAQDRAEIAQIGQRG